MNTAKQVLITLAVVIAAFWAYNEWKTGGVVNPVVQPVYITPAPVQVNSVNVIIQAQPTYPPPVNVMALPTAVIPPTQEINRGGFEAQPAATGIVGVHDPGTGHHRTP